MDTSYVQETISGLSEVIRTRLPGLLDRFPVEQYISLLDSQTLYGNYGSIPDSAKLYCQEILSFADEAALSSYHQLVLLTLITQFDARLSQRRIPSSIIELFEIEFARIVDEISGSKTASYVPGNDRFMKDLSICRLKLYPCGAELLDELSGIPRSVLARGNVAQMIRSARFFLLGKHGFRPYYELHMHAPLRQHFHPDGWVACYRRVAELLALNPEVNGVTCSSWWYDPQLKTISPRLTYLREFLLDNGAEIFHIRADHDASYGATEKSATRLKLFESGEYVPQIYMAIWPRRALINWAATSGAGARTN